MRKEKLLEAKEKKNDKKIREILFLNIYFIDIRSERGLKVRWINANMMLLIDHVGRFNGR